MLGAYEDPAGQGREFEEPENFFYMVTAVRNQKVWGFTGSAWKAVVYPISDEAAVRKDFENLGTAGLKELDGPGTYEIRLVRLTGRKDETEVLETKWLEAV